MDAVRLTLCRQTKGTRCAVSAVKCPFLQARTVDPEVAQQLEAQPALLNLARSLLFHKQQLASAPLPAAARAAQGECVQDLTEMLRTIMCL